MTASLIKRGDILETRSVSLTTCGVVHDKGIIVPGTRVKIVRAEKPAFYKCEVQPVERENGAVFVWLWASELKPSNGRDQRPGDQDA